MNILISFIPLLLLAGIIALVITASRHRAPADEPGIGTVRRLLGYGASLAGLALMVGGASLLLRTILGAVLDDNTIAGDETTLALGLALTIVGAPVWAAAWMLMTRAARTHPVELRTLARKLYIYTVLAGSALTAIFSAIQFFSTAGRDGEADETSLAIAILTSIVWVFHWRVESGEGQLNLVTMTVRRAYVYALSAVGVVVGSVGLTILLTVFMAAAYRAMFGGDDLIAGQSGLWGESTQSAVAQVVIGGLVAWWHWLRNTGRDAGSLMRSVYLYPLAILGGAIATVAAASVGLYHVLQWWFGDPSTPSARAHFDIFPALLATCVVGGGIWIYHWQVARQESAADPRSAESASRIYHYLVSAIGLAAVAVGITIAFELFIGLASPSDWPNLRGDLWRNPLALVLTLLIVGLPLWLWSWRIVQSAAAAHGPVERDSLSRRIFIYGMFGVALTATLINLSIVLFFVFEAFLGDRAAERLLWDSRWSIAILLTAAVATSYFWQVLREDRAALAGVERPEPHQRAHKRVTVLAGSGGLELARRLDQELGYEARLLQGVSGLEGVGQPDDAEVRRAVEQVRGASSEHVMVIAEGGRLRVVPYEQ